MEGGPSLGQHTHRGAQIANMNQEKSGTFFKPLNSERRPSVFSTDRKGGSMTQESKYFEIHEVEGAVEFILGSSDFVSRPIIVLAFEELTKYVDENEPERVILNFRNVQHVSSEFITEMIRLNDHVGGHDGTLKLSHMSTDVEFPFKMTNLSGTLFKIYETTPQAIDAF